MFEMLVELLDAQSASKLERRRPEGWCVSDSADEPISEVGTSRTSSTRITAASVALTPTAESLRC
jgi:hypothetical protein